MVEAPKDLELDALIAKLEIQPRLANGQLNARRYSALYYVTELLKLLRQRQDEYRVKRYTCSERRFIENLARHMEALVSEFFSGGMMQPRSPIDHRLALEPLKDMLRSLEGENELNRPVLLTRALAVAIDKTALADIAITQFKNYYLADDGSASGEAVMQPVRSGDPVPTCFGIFGKHEETHDRARKKDFGTNPQNLPAWRKPDRVPNVVLAPPIVDSFRLVLNFDYEHELLNIQRGATMVAAILPTKDLATDFSFSYHQDRDRFFNVRRRCGDDDNSPMAGAQAAPFASQAEFRKKLADAMTKAANAGANLVILPELVMSERDLGEMRAAWASVVEAHRGHDVPEHTKPQMMIPGTWHTIRSPNKNVNTSELWGSRVGVGATDITKVVPYAHRLSNEATIVEDINTPRTPDLVLFCSPNATMLVMVCVDFLLDELRDLARDLYVSLVIIPSMSEKNRIFRELMVGHVAATEAVTIFVDALSPTDDPLGALAVVQHPDGASGVEVNSKTVRRLAEQRGVAVISLEPGKRRVKWIEI